MPRIPSEFFFERRLVSGATRREIAAIQFLLNDARYSRLVGVDVDGTRRCEILADLADALNFAHRLGIVVNDISPMNVLWSTTDRCRVFVIDADSMALNGRLATSYVETPAWRAPASTYDQISDHIPQRSDDIFKFALMVIRVLAGSQDLKNPAELTECLSDIKSLAAASLSIDMDDRPSAAEWARVLHLTAQTNPELPWLQTPAVPIIIHHKNDYKQKHTQLRNTQQITKTSDLLSDSSTAKTKITDNISRNVNPTQAQSLIPNDALTKNQSPVQARSQFSGILIIKKLLQKKPLATILISGLLLAIILSIIFRLLQGLGGAG